MFGSVFKMQAKPGKKQDLINLMMAQDDRSPEGMVSAYMFDAAGDELWGVAVFADEKTYRANAASPDQDAQYQKMRALLAADPEWHDATVVPAPVNRG